MGLKRARAPRLHGAGGGSPRPRTSRPRRAPARCRRRWRRALDTAHEVAGIPLRAMTYVLEPREKDTTHILVAAEFDASVPHLPGLRGNRGRPASRSPPPRLCAIPARPCYSDERVEVRAPEGERPGWRSVAREFDLPPGIAQARLIVHDPGHRERWARSRRGSRCHRPASYASTPILSDQVIRPSTPGGKPRAAVAAYRKFRPAAASTASSRFSGRPGIQSDGQPRVSSGLAVHSAAGETVREASPTRIAADRDGRVARLAGLDLTGLPEGAYELVLAVHDEVGGATVERREPFTIAP